MSEFERACADFTHQMEIAANWEANYFGAAIRTRLISAIADVRTACDQMEKAMAEDRK